MTTQEIKDLVAAKIAGQGNQIDLGNALPEIIYALCSLIEDAPKIPAIEVTRKLTDHPDAISLDEYNMYRSQPILLYGGDAFVISSVNINQFIEGGLIGTVYCRSVNYTQGDTEANTCMAIGLYSDAGGTYITLIDY